LYLVLKQRGIIMNTNLQTRPTNMALAFINAAVKPIKKQGNKAVWMARRVAINADREIGTVSEPRLNAHLSKKTATELIARGIL
jgi:hypothetical protein